MSDEKKGISLRKKKNNNVRPKISAPQPVPEDGTPGHTPLMGGGSFEPPPLQRVETSQSSLRSRPSMHADRTADLVKRRYSTRFVGYPHDDRLAPPMPAMPSLPVEYQSVRSAPPSRDGKPPEAGGKSLKVDIRALRDQNLVPEQYIAHILADADETDIANYQTELRKLKHRTDTDLQHNVYQNRTQFIKISKEAEKLKTEMRTLRGLMSEMTSALHQAAQAGGAEVSAMSVADRKRANRSSVANLEALWSSHLQALWKRVEGAQKYLPAVPGRHIVYESSRWVELNAATWKPRRRVHLILLNDHLLIATEKKRAEGMPSTSPNLSSNRRVSMYGNASAQAPTTLIADRCFPLSDVTMSDISRNAPTSSDPKRSPVSNAITVRSATESFTFATGNSTDSSAEKNTLLVSFRKAGEELRKTVAAEHGERERQLSTDLLAPGSDGRRGSSTRSSPMLGFSSDRFGGGGAMIDVDGRPQPIRWVETQIDALDIDIALQRFEDAVARVEKLRRLARSIRGNASAQEMFLAKIDERAGKLAGVVCKRLRLGSAGLEKTRENVAWLIRLGVDEVAVREYLSARTAVVKNRTRQLPFTGALAPHVRALSYIVFTVVLHTFRIFSQSFPGANYTSAVVKWAKERVDEFNEMLARQLSSVPRGSELFEECLAIAREQCAVLREVGVDFEGFVGRGVGEDGVVGVGVEEVARGVEGLKVNGLNTNGIVNGRLGVPSPVDGGVSPMDDEGRRLGSKGIGVGKRMF
ncbi:putative exocyst complex component exo84 [Elsinoe australis]|uniref:Exocyst complex component EXO84 n=1 Tax=Elsinoe australis TaxID=40998 RepID=A0A4U7B2L3_9PEZI|nr:putative exocyst complex component exo84 [Elsinoe australis]